MVNESHNIKTLEGLPLGRLKKLHAKYKGKGTKEAAREASNIKRIIASRIDESKQRKRNGEMRILPRADETSGTGKTYETFVSEMSRFADPHWQPLDASNPGMFDRILAARRKKEDETRANANLANAQGFKKLSKKHQERLAKAFDPPKPTNEALGINEEYNKGHKAEKKLIASGQRHKLLSPGDLSGRGPDSFLHHPNGKTYGMGIKAEGAAAGQIRLHYHPKKGWHFNPGEKPKRKKPLHAMTDEERHSHKTAVGKWRMGKAIADHLHREGVHHQFGKHLGRPKDHSQEGISRHFAKVVKEKGEPKTTFDTEGKHRLVRAIRTGMNGDHMVHIMGKGTYALHPKIAKESGIPYLGNHIDDEDIPFALSYRGRDKLHNRGDPKRVTVQSNLDHGVIEPTPSHTNIEHHLNKLDRERRKAAKKKTVKKKIVSESENKLTFPKGIPKGAPQSFVSLIKNAEKQKRRMEERKKKAAQKPPKPTNEAVSTGDPNRGKKWRAKPRLPPGQDPYDMYMSSASMSDTNKPAIRPYGGKLKKRLSSLSYEARQRYYREIGMRSRAASRAGTTGRLFPQG